MGIYPFEIAAQLDAISRKRGIRDKTTITLIHLFKRPIEPLGPEALKITGEASAAKGVNYVGGAQPRGREEQDYYGGGRQVQIRLAHSSSAISPVKGVWGLLTALGDPDVQRGLDVALALLKALGKQ